MQQTCRPSLWRPLSQFRWFADKATVIDDVSRTGKSLSDTHLYSAHRSPSVPEYQQSGNPLFPATCSFAK